MAIDDRYGLATAVDEGLLAGPVRLAQAALLARPPRTVAPAVERRSRLSLIALAPNKTAKAVKAAILKVLQPLSAQVHTLTYDNGKEFAYHMEIAKVLKANGYFAHPYHSWERGLNENTNGLIRQYLPKGTDFNKLTDKQVLEIMDKLNNRPRKCLGYKTPNQVFFGIKPPVALAS